MLGDGRLAVNVDPGNHGPNYQGIVPLAGTTLDQCLEAYFDQSEQLATRLYLRCHDSGVSGLLLQALPAADDASDALETLAALAATVTGEELQRLEAETLLRRLFASYTLRLFSAPCRNPRLPLHGRASRGHRADAGRSRGQRDPRRAR